MPPWTKCTCNDAETQRGQATNQPRSTEVENSHSLVKVRRAPGGDWNLALLPGLRHSGWDAGAHS